MVLLDCVTDWVCVVEPDDPPEVDLADWPATCVVPLVLPAAALAPTELDCRLVLPAPALPVVVGVLVLVAVPWVAVALPPTARWFVVLLWLSRWLCIVLEPAEPLEPEPAAAGVFEEDPEGAAAAFQEPLEGAAAALHEAPPEGAAAAFQEPLEGAAAALEELPEGAEAEPCQTQ